MIKVFNYDSTHKNQSKFYLNIIQIISSYNTYAKSIFDVKKMRNYNKALLIIAILLVGGGVGFFVYGFATAGTIRETATFTYEPTSPGPFEDLTVNVDIGSIIFMYNESPMASYARFDVYIEIYARKVGSQV